MGASRTTFSLRFIDNGRAHDDLVLRLGKREWICDSYYLMIDQGLLADRNDFQKVRIVLERLLQQWLNTVPELADAQTAYLPYDFSDQYTGWIRCRCSGESLEITPGSSMIEAWRILPSDIGQLLLDLPDFRSTDETIIMARNEFLQLITDSLDFAAASIQ
ncbi:MAG TPA: hypothetical protein VGM03_09755 [Phycisphaerae bacterium]